VRNERDAIDYSFDMDTVEAGGGELSPFTLVAVTLTLTLYGLISLYSASIPDAISSGLMHYHYLLRQGIFGVLGLISAVILAKIPVKLVKYSFAFLLPLSLVLMVLTLYSPWGVTVMGARRWLSFPHLPSFQPVEILKLSMILFLSFWFSNGKAKSLRGWFYTVPLFLVLLFSLLTVLQKAYTTTMLFLITCIIMCITGGLRLRWVFVFLAYLFPPAVCVLFSESYRVKRIASYLIRDLDPTGLNWQVNVSLKAISEGGILGKGIGNGEYKNGLLPEVANDFIFSNIVEETGLLGAFFVFFLFLVFALVGIRTALRLKGRDTFLSVMAIGITAMVSVQAVINVAVVTGILPPTGIPLPFFSQGGTNLFVILSECGLLYRAAKESVG